MSNVDEPTIVDRWVCPVCNEENVNFEDEVPLTFCANQDCGADRPK